MNTRGYPQSLLLLFSLALYACGTAQPERPMDSVVEAVPAPDLAGLEPATRERLLALLLTLEPDTPETPAARAVAFGDAGMTLHAYNFHDSAASCYRNAMHLAPSEHAWPYLLGLVLQDAHREDESIAAFTRALEIAPDHAPTYVHLGERMLARDALAQAAHYFDAALTLDPTLNAARFGRGKVALAAKQFDLAAELLEQTLRLAPQASAAHYPLALAYRNLGNTEQATRHLALRGTTAPRLDDPLMQRVAAAIDGMRVHQLRGTESYRAGRFDEARVEFEAALQNQPDSPIVLTNLALTWIQLGDPDQAERLLRRAVELTPEDTFAHYNLGTLLASRHDDRAALVEFERTLTLDPAHTTAQINLANALCRVGRCAEAYRWYERAAVGDPGNPHLRVGMARALGAAGRWPAAATLLEQAQRERPADGELRSALARLLAAAPDATLRDARRALQIAQPLLRGQPTLEQTETFAMVAAENGQFAQAIELQRRVLSAADATLSTSRKRQLQINLERYQQERACRSPWGDTLE